MAEEKNNNIKTQIISDSQLLNLKLDRILNILYEKSMLEEKEQKEGTFKSK